MEYVPIEFVAYPVHMTQYITRYNLHCLSALPYAGIPPYTGWHPRRYFESGSSDVFGSLSWGRGNRLITSLLLDSKY